MFEPAVGLSITSDQQERLEILAHSGKTPQKVALRARIILAAAEGRPNNAISAELGVSRPTVLLWRKRFVQLGVAGILRDGKRPGRRPSISAEVERRVVDATLKTTPAGETHWSTRTMAAAQGVSRASVNRIWLRHGLKPHRVRTFKLSKDPAFVQKLRDVVGVYMNPPENAVVFSIDEKTQIQALDRTQPGLPLKKGRCGTLTHDYKRHGTTTLFAALNVLTGKVIGMCTPQHRGVDFVRFLRRVKRSTAPDREVHVVIDNASSHLCPEVQEWLRENPNFHFHLTPTGSSWLNLIESWFAQLTKKRLKRGVFRSVPELIAAIEEYLSAYNEKPSQFVWTKSASSILKKVARCKDALETLH